MRHAEDNVGYPGSCTTTVHSGSLLSQPSPVESTPLSRGYRTSARPHAATTHDHDSDVVRARPACDQLHTLGQDAVPHRCLATPMTATPCSDGES